MPSKWYSSGMQATIDQAGRLVIPKQLRDHVGMRPGKVEVTVDGSGLRIELPAEDALLERNGRLVIGGGGLRVDDKMVRSLRDVGQR
jgi:AbrB family looped-hinge helix DNA binding protein